eukprot:SAG31_NODE_21510_length_547_cov_2.680804_1_plen_81_part_01
MLAFVSMSPHESCDASARARGEGRLALPRITLWFGTGRTHPEGLEDAAARGVAGVVGAWGPVGPACGADSRVAAALAVRV